MSQTVTRTNSTLHETIGLTVTDTDFGPGVGVNAPVIRDRFVVHDPIKRYIKRTYPDGVTQRKGAYATSYQTGSNTNYEVLPASGAEDQFFHRWDNYLLDASTGNNVVNPNSGYGAAYYYREGSRLYFNGFIRQIATLSTARTVFKLPVGYRPRVISTFATSFYGYNSAAGVNEHMGCTFYVHNNGEVSIQWETSSSPGVNFGVSQIYHLSMNGSISLY